MSTISSGTTLTTALVQTGDTTGDLVIKTGSSNTTAMTISGTDQSVTLAGALTANTNASTITTGTVPTARLGSGTADNTTYLRGDQTWAAVTIPASNNKQVFTSSGTFTVPAGVSMVKVTVIGAGGNGGTGNEGNGTTGGGGGAGGYIVDYVSVTPGGSATVTVGTNAGTRTSSFVGGSTITASGGANGSNATGDNGNSGASGTASVFGQTYYVPGPRRDSNNARGSGGSLMIITGNGATGDSVYNGQVYNHGFGISGSTNYNTSIFNQRHTALGFGAGGGAGSQIASSAAGGVGTNGLVIVEW